MDTFQVVSLTAALLSIATLVGVFSYLRRGPEDTFRVAVIRAINMPVALVVHRLKILGNPGSVPETGPCILVANHQSGCDPCLVALVTRRWIRFLMAREYYETRGVRWFFRLLECIPVNRDGRDLTATRQALEALRTGQVVCIFPQGGIREPEDQLVGKAGVALLAMHAKVPVVPLYLEGTPESDSVYAAIFWPSRSRVYCGKPLYAHARGGKPTREEMEHFTTEILSAISELKKVAETTRLKENKMERVG